MCLYIRVCSCSPAVPGQWVETSAGLTSFVSPLPGTRQHAQRSLTSTSTARLALGHRSPRETHEESPLSSRPGCKRYRRLHCFRHPQVCLPETRRFLQSADSVARPSCSPEGKAGSRALHDGLDGLDSAWTRNVLCEFQGKEKALPPSVSVLLWFWFLVFGFWLVSLVGLGFWFFLFCFVFGFVLVFVRFLS